MQTKIKEILTEPTKIEVGSVFRLKVKVIRYLTYDELTTKIYDYLKNFTYNDLEGK